MKKRIVTGKKIMPAEIKPKSLPIVLDAELLHANEENFKSIFENAAEGILIADIDTKKFCLGNKSICQLTGYSSEEIKNLGVMDIHPEKDLPYVLSQFESQLKGEFSIARNLPVKRKDGSVFYVDVNATKIKIAGKTYLMGFFHDNTERRQAEKQLQEKEARYRGLFMSSFDAIMTLEPPSWKFTSGNQATIEMFKAKNEAEFLSQTLWKLSPERQLDGRLSTEKAREMIGLAMREGLSSFEWLHQRLNGEEFFAEVKLSRVKINGNTFLHAIVRDITEQKKTQDSLIRLKRAIEFSGEAVFLTDRDGLITYINPGFTAIYGYSPEEVVGKATPRILKSGVLKPEIYAKFWVDLLNKKVIKGELINKHKDGGLIDVEGSANAILDNQGKIIGFLAIQHDISERKKNRRKVKDNRTVEKG